MGLCSYIGQNQWWFSSYRWTHYCNSVKPSHLNIALLGYCCHRSMHVRFSLYLLQIGRKSCQSQSGLYGGEILTDRPLLTSYDGSPRISRMQFASSYYLRDSDIWWSRPLEDKGLFGCFLVHFFLGKSLFLCIITFFSDGGCLAKSITECTTWENDGSKYIHSSENVMVVLHYLCSTVLPIC